MTSDNRKKPSPTSAALQTGTIVSAYGKRYGVHLDNASNETEISCVTRGKKTDLACGDRVDILLTDSAEGVIEKTHERQSLLYRSNAFRSKLLAANVSQVLIVLAIIPSFYEALLNRCLIAAEAAEIKATILLNKIDAGDPQATLNTLRYYEGLGYDVIPLSAKQDISCLLPYLAGQTSVLVGQSGMGKSTIINQLLPTAQAKTREVSMVLDSGKHTTTAAHLYYLNESSRIIDSPGLQEFGLNHLSIEAIEQAFIEFRPYLGHCRFQDCRHLHEPDCRLREAEQAGKIANSRLALFHQLLIESRNSL